MNLATPVAEDYFRPELMRLLATARQIIQQHVNNRGCCADCGLAWPCQQAQLAEHALAAL
jgi:hypothetical protein